MTDLSTAAQAVLDAALQYEINPECYSREIAAAALRTLAKQIGYNNYYLDGDHGLAVVNVRDILSIADELEAGNSL